MGGGLGGTLALIRLIAGWDNIAAATGHQVAGLRRPGGRPVPTRYRSVAGDPAVPSTLTAAATGFDHVIHTGAPVNADADLAQVGALIASGSPLIYTTGAGVLGTGATDEDSPPDPHPVVAWRPAVERYVLDAGGRIVRPGLVYGNGGGLVHGLFAAKAADHGTGLYIGEPGARTPVVHVKDLAALYLAVASAAAPGTVWHGIAETVRYDAIAEALGDGESTSWPLDEATAELGSVADLLTRDQDVSSAKTRNELGWTPAHTSMTKHLMTSS